MSDNPIQPRNLDVVIFYDDDEGDEDLGHIKTSRFGMDHHLRALHSGGNTNSLLWITSVYPWASKEDLA